MHLLIFLFENNTMEFARVFLPSAMYVKNVFGGNFNNYKQCPLV